MGQAGTEADQRDEAEIESLHANVIFLITVVASAHAQESTDLDNRRWRVEGGFLTRAVFSEPMVPTTNSISIGILPSVITPLFPERSIGGSAGSTTCCLVSLPSPAPER